MEPGARSALEGWADYSVIVGGAAGALTGLQFVVMTLIAQVNAAPRRGSTIAAFGTPNVVHFCAALLVSALLSLPWGSLRGAGIAIALVGLAGEVYSLIVMRHAQRQSDYEPVLEDWIWHNILPFVGYTTLFVGGIVLARDVPGALFAIGPVALLLVFVGIHNAWDTVTYMLVGGGREAAGAREEAKSAGSAAPSPEGSAGSTERGA